MSDQDDIDEMPPKNPTYTFSPEQFNELMNRIGALGQGPPPQVNTGNFSGCTSRFDGSAGTDVEPFLDAVITYKDCTGVSDENGLRGLSMLLENDAASWWRGVKDDIPTWQEAVEALRSAYSKKLPPHRIYREMFSREQREDEKTELFISRFREMTAQLPYRLDEKVQLDMLYGLLHRRIRERITRTQFQTFQKLLTCVRDVEESTRGDNEPDHHQSDPKRRPRCSFCKRFGHESAECRSRKGRIVKEETKITTEGVKPSVATARPNISCYGCGREGYVKSRCPTCTTGLKAESARTPNSNTGEFCLISDINAVDSRPRLSLTILGHFGSGIVDTAAKRSVAGYSLYQILRKEGLKMQEDLMEVTFADGLPRTEVVLKVNVVVEVAERPVRSEFIIFPEYTQNHTLLGVDFVSAARIAINVPDGHWSFVDEPGNQRAFHNAPEIKAAMTHVSATAIGDAALQVAATDADGPDQLRAEEGAALRDVQRQDLSRLLNDYLDVFGKSTEATKFAEHVINTGSADPISTPPYRVSLDKRKPMQTLIDEMLKDDVIEPCESAWAAPLVMVPKKDGTYRLCVDYRRLNDVTSNDKYPLPRMEDLLHLAKRTPFMSTIDLRSGYHQVPVRERDRDKTAFVCPFGTYRFKRMPFGLKTAGSTFQRLIDRFRAGLSNVKVFAYLDDIIVLSPTFEDHIRDLKLVFERLRLFGLRARREKCVFVKAEVRYLGHVITPAGIQADPEKVAAVTNMKPPTNLKQLQSFLQTCSWFRRFIDGFARISRPLTQLTKKNARWRWETEQQLAFDELKKGLTEAPILRQADENLPYVLKTDASGYALGACLLQGEPPREQPIEYASRMMTAAERNYSTTEREALAIVWALGRYRGYVDGAKVIVCTDHQALKWLMTLKSPSGRLARWALALQPYDLEIRYNPGKRNFVADLLSRPFCDEQTEVCQVAVDFPITGSKTLREEQVADPEVKKIIDALESQSDSIEFIRWCERGYLLNDGVLYRYVPEHDAENAQLVVPRQKREEILKTYHDAPEAGHYGIENTQKRICSRYFWPGMSAFIRDYVKRCVKCQKYKVSNQKPAGLLQTPVQGQRFETVAVDYFGPLPETEHGYRWILVAEDTASRWVELIPLREATAEETAKALINEVFLRYGLPRRMISDNGTQFVSQVMQQVADVLEIKQELNPVYHPEANPVERKNRDMKTQLSILVGNAHDQWVDKLPAVRYAMNTAPCQSTGQTAAFLTFGRELRTLRDVAEDLRPIVRSGNYVEQMKPFLLGLSRTLRDAREENESRQDARKERADRGRADAPSYQEGDLVLVNTRLLSDKTRRITSKFATKRDGPYRITRRVSPTAYEISDDPAIGKYVGVHHVSDLRPFITSANEIPSPIVPRKRRGRPPKGSDPASRVEPTLVLSELPPRNAEGEGVTGAPEDTPSARDVPRRACARESRGSWRSLAATGDI